MCDKVKVKLNILQFPVWIEYIKKKSFIGHGNVPFIYFSVIVLGHSDQKLPSRGKPWLHLTVWGHSPSFWKFRSEIIVGAWSRNNRGMLLANNQDNPQQICPLANQI